MKSGTVHVLILYVDHRLHSEYRTMRLCIMHTTTSLMRTVSKTAPDSVRYVMGRKSRTRVVPGTAYVDLRGFPKCHQCSCLGSGFTLWTSLQYSPLHHVCCGSFWQSEYESLVSFLFSTFLDRILSTEPEELKNKQDIDYAWVLFFEALPCW